MRRVLVVSLAAGLWGCGTDCDDAAGKLAFCELPAPASLAGACDDETVLACQARCVRDTSCDQLALSIAGGEGDFDRCATSCGATDLFAELTEQVGGGGESGGAGGDANAEQ